MIPDDAGDPSQDCPALGSCLVRGQDRRGRAILRDSGIFQGFSTSQPDRDHLSRCRQRVRQDRQDRRTLQDFSGMEPTARCSNEILEGPPTNFKVSEDLQGSSRIFKDLRGSQRISRALRRSRFNSNASNIDPLNQRKK